MDNSSVLRAVIFDCDGVIANTEPLHFATFKQVLAERGINLDEEEYYREFLAYDDRGAFERIFAKRRVELEAGEIPQLIDRKASFIEPIMRERLELFPGVVEFVRSASRAVPIAVASGALRHEVDLILRFGGILDQFITVVAAEDVSNGKPHPEPFQEALARINTAVSSEIPPRQCLVIEDSVHGINAANAAGMICMAITNSYEPDRLAAADLVVTTLEGLDLPEIERQLAVRATPSSPDR
jgi:HAD superfamily hydrolase (TIGR01509 family)